ncbi:strawberry notch C-terminal domain-containing protein [Bradyrhizobium sp. 159]|uniref:strawberry notch C-terminal domain-containing protein n=1 Tax=unclassified Bradyrhizobium TaxID=2631580 RepID=UPI001FFC0557|nr:MULTISPECIES: strawberry notch C-terminal domain-containing protein [unclassified Bradyrhizobium]MCK1619176.1 strawberry notch C-terminal domain-containing protein [Bradyrhizobium sp. 159]MCK1754627.1 strawberry notch C-terminal domain-containing protein [Bradyrhizobium sp. 137]
MTDSLASGAAAAPLPMRAAATITSAAVRAARQLLTDLERGRRIDAAVLRGAMEAAFGASDAAGSWNWKTAYDTCEAATVLFLRKFGPAMGTKAGSTAAMLPMLARVASLLPTHTRRSEDSQALQQFSTPIPLRLAACTAACITPSDWVLEPSAGTGLLAIFGELAGGALVLNELSEPRAELLDHLFAGVEVTRFDAAQIDDHLEADFVPSVVLMNPPFSALANVDRRMADAALRHIASALARLCDGGRLVAITGASFGPDNPAWRDAFVRLQGRARVVFSAAIDGAVYAILVFSDAGGTGRSYHAELSARNRCLRVHYLLEPGWKADAAIQGLGQTNRTNQAQPPLFRPVATDVKAEKRFLSTIARRLDTLGAITRGQRQTGGQGLFRPEDNLESQYGRDALRQLYTLLARGKVDGCSLETFEGATGLKLTDTNGPRDDLPPITTFLNRLLALTIELQNILFTVFEQLLAARIEGAVASGTYDLGLETLRAESFVVTDRSTIYTHPGTGAETRLLTITQRQRTHPVSLDDALARRSDHRAVLLINERSGRAALQLPAPSFILDDGEIERRVRLIHPMEQHSARLTMMAESHWVEADRDGFAAAWLAELAEVPEFTESMIHVVAGLLLPIWKRLPNEPTRVYRLQTDAGERVIGRKVSATWVANLLAADAPALTPDAAFAALMEGRTVLELAEGLQLRRARVMGAYRIELSGFNDTMRDRLRAYGLFGGIISWKLRIFVPTDASGVEILAKVLEQYPVARISEREAA